MFLSFSYHKSILCEAQQQRKWYWSTVESGQDPVLLSKPGRPGSMDHSAPNCNQNPQYVKQKITPLIIHPDSLFSNDSLTSLPSSASPLSGPSRPHRLLVFINPFGGKKRGKQIFHSLVAPLFELAGISSHVVGKILRLYLYRSITEQLSSVPRLVSDTSCTSGSTVLK